MRDRLRTAAALAALLASAACWSDVNEQQSPDSVGAYEAPAGVDSGVPMGGPLPTPVDTGDTSGGAAGSGMPPAGGRDTSSGTPPR